MNVESIIDTINKPNAVAGDYRDKEGLLHCGKCHEAKEAWIELRVGKKLVRCACQCAEAEMKESDDQERRKRIEDLRTSCLPAEAMRKHTFSAADPDDHILKARRYVEAWPRMKEKNIGIVFYGPTGTGKSYAAHCIANALIDKEIPSVYYSAPDLISWMTEREKREDILSRIIKAPLLIIDDIGAEHDSSYSRAQMCAVIDHRIESGRPLIVTTNYTLSEMQSSPDKELARIFDRILKACVPLRVVGESKRQIQGKANKEWAKTILDG